MPAERVCVAQIGAPHGVRGEVRLFAFTEDPLAVTRYGPLQSEDGAREVEIESARPGKQGLVVRLRGVGDRDAAARLRNVRLYVARSRLPATGDADTFYHADLIGLAAMTPDGRRLGTVTAVQNFGAGDILEIRPEAGGETLMLPFTTDAVPSIDVAGGRIVVDPPLLIGEDEAPSRQERAAGRRAARKPGAR
jgi:16S rRNA processing protein RimM